MVAGGWHHLACGGCQRSHAAGTGPGVDLLLGVTSLSVRQAQGRLFGTCQWRYKPGTASWAKFSRPYGTRLGDGCEKSDRWASVRFPSALLRVRSLEGSAISYFCCSFWVAIWPAAVL